MDPEFVDNDTFVESISTIIEGIIKDIDAIDNIFSESSGFDTDVMSEAMTDIQEWVRKTEKDPVSYRCEHCNTVFKRKDSYRRHISESRSCATIRSAKGMPVLLDLHRCGVCNETFTRESSLITHMAAYHT